jgi:flagellar export protein FliJ
MRPFRFTLESVLTLRSREEETARQSYAEALAFQARTNEALDQAMNDLDALQSELSEKRQATSKRDDQIMFIQAIRQQRSFCDAMTQRLARAVQLVEVRMKLWLDARRKTQVLQKLKDKRSQIHDAEMRRLEEREIEDMISARWVATRVSALR